MSQHFTTRLATCFALAFAFGIPAANAQYKQYPTSQPPTGEKYHVEVAFGIWNPTPQVLVSSESLGIVGTTIDGVADLNMQKTSFKEFRLVLRPGRKHKFLFDYIPISYQAEQPRLQRTIVFNGIKYNVGVPVNSSLDWKSYRFAYEYDFIYRDRGFFGFVVDAKYTDVEVNLASPILPNVEYARAAAPIPGLGVVGRIYPLGNLSITGEFTAFKLPGAVGERYDGKYFDFDLYGTLNFTKNFGVQAGWRSLDVMYKVDEDNGDFTLKGLYFMGVARF